MKKVFINISIIFIFTIIWIYLWILTNNFICKTDFFQNSSVCEIKANWEERFWLTFALSWIIFSYFILFLIYKKQKKPAIS